MGRRRHERRAHGQATRDGTCFRMRRAESVTRRSVQSIEDISAIASYETSGLENLNNDPDRTTTTSVGNLIGNYRLTATWGFSRMNSATPASVIFVFLISRSLNLGQVRSAARAESSTGV